MNSVAEILAIGYGGIMVTSALIAVMLGERKRRQELIPVKSAPDTK